MQLPPPSAKHGATDAVVFDYPASWFTNSGLSAAALLTEQYSADDPEADEPQPATGAQYLAKRAEALQAALEEELAEDDEPEELSEESRARRREAGLAVGTEVYAAAAAAKRARKEPLLRDEALAAEERAILADSARMASIRARHVERQRTEQLALQVLATFGCQLIEYRLPRCVMR